MITNLTKEQLIAFEEYIAQVFNEGKIKAPVHLYNGNEDEMLKVFQEIKEEDWVFCTWRSHYQCLLKGIDPALLKDDIIKGKSISLCYPSHNIFSSAIVTGSLPIAVGTAMGLKLQGKKGKVYCFVGDMGAETGMFMECFKYSIGQSLPIKFIIEDNNKSVCTNTRKTWSEENILTWDAAGRMYGLEGYLYHYKYESKWPHAGAGKRIQF